MNDANRTGTLLFAWCGPAGAVFFCLGGTILGGFIPPMLSPTLSGSEMVQIIGENQTRIRIGVFFMIVALGLMAPWGASIAARTRRIEGANPVFTYVQLTCIGASVALFVLFCVPWALAAYRPQEYGPQTVQMLVDTAYFLALFAWPTTSAWSVAVALAILHDKGERPVYPRWLAYLSLWAALLFVPGGLVLYFKNGPFAWDGILGLYIPFVAFFLWMLGMTYYTIASVKNDARDAGREAAAASRGGA